MTEEREDIQTTEAAAPEPEPEAEAPEAEAPEADPSAVEHDLDELLAKANERDEYLSLAQRTQADFENYRKRAARDMAAAESRGAARLAKEILPALDNLGRAVEAEGSADDLAQGVRLVQSELQGALERAGIEAYSPEGERFDPNVHEAMARQPVEGAESGTVVEVLQRGYRMNGAVLRPARVVVAE